MLFVFLILKRNRWNLFGEAFKPSHPIVNSSAGVHRNHSWLNNNHPVLENKSYLNNQSVLFHPQYWEVSGWGGKDGLNVWAKFGSGHHYKQLFKDICRQTCWNLAYNEHNSLVSHYWSIKRPVKPVEEKMGPSGWSHQIDTNTKNRTGCCNIKW